MAFATSRCEQLEAMLGVGLRCTSKTMHAWCLVRNYHKSARCRHHHEKLRVLINTDQQFILQATAGRGDCALFAVLRGLDEGDYKIDRDSGGNPTSHERATVEQAAANNLRADVADLVAGDSSLDVAFSSAAERARWADEYRKQGVYSDQPALLAMARKLQCAVHVYRDEYSRRRPP
jgi:hypothetical protein